MSDYQDCTLIEIRGAREFVVDARRVHADALLPLPSDPATMLRMLCEGTRAKALPTIAPDLDYFDEAQLLDKASGFFDDVEVLACGARAGQLEARYRIRLRTNLDWRRHEAGARWGAAAAVWLPGVGGAPSELLTHLARNARGKKGGTPAERLATLKNIIRTRVRDVGAAAKQLGTFEAEASDMAFELSRFLYYPYLAVDVAPALGLLGHPSAVGPLVLALLHTERLRLPHDKPCAPYFQQALAWLGPIAKPLAEAVLRAPGEETLELDFARWRVLGDDDARRRFVATKAPSNVNAALMFKLRRKALLIDGPSTQLRDIIDGVREGLRKKKDLDGLGTSFAQLEKVALARCAKA
ncbi:hypothetical protein [Polyangium mundeleinium]|uniref:Uncharacterized protein n=1 Tax=Polyangium mundeleinium TaxID=2995306 RepID=A0ABT5EK61_9BACT|nr:hypothetical protein [Polyangium mundeleinium]MDC0741327.1 hypothetical protein [Polyangium mundeleinium]